MKTLHRNKRKFSICTVYRDGNLKKYREPKLMRDNWEPIRDGAEFMNLGLEVYNYIRIKTDASHAEDYHLGDRCYIYVTPPAEHDELCKTADFEVCKDPIVTLNECDVLLEKLSGRNGDRNIF